MEKLNNDKKHAKKAVDKYKEKRMDMCTIERMLFLREALKNITHLGAHHEDQISRHQAQSILGITVSVLACPEVGIQA